MQPCMQNSYKRVRTATNFPGRHRFQNQVGPGKNLDLGSGEGSLSGSVGTPGERRKRQLMELGAAQRNVLPSDLSSDDGPQGAPQPVEKEVSRYVGDQLIQAEKVLNTLQRRRQRRYDAENVHKIQLMMSSSGSPQWSRDQRTANGKYSSGADSFSSSDEALKSTESLSNSQIIKPESTSKNNDDNEDFIITEESTILRIQPGQEEDEEIRNVLRPKTFRSSSLDNSINRMVNLKPSWMTPTGAYPSESPRRRRRENLNRNVVRGSYYSPDGHVTHDDYGSRLSNEKLEINNRPPKLSPYDNDGMDDLAYSREIRSSAQSNQSSYRGGGSQQRYQTGITLRLQNSVGSEYDDQLRTSLAFRTPSINEITQSDSTYSDCLNSTADTFRTPSYSDRFMSESSYSSRQPSTCDFMSPVPREYCVSSSLFSDQQNSNIHSNSTAFSSGQNSARGSRASNSSMVIRTSVNIPDLNRFQSDHLTDNTHQKRNVSENGYDNAELQKGVNDTIFPRETNIIDSSPEIFEVEAVNSSIFPPRPRLPQEFSHARVLPVSNMPPSYSDLTKSENNNRFVVAEAATSDAAYTACITSPSIDSQTVSVDRQQSGVVNDGHTCGLEDRFSDHVDPTSVTLAAHSVKTPVYRNIAPVSNIYTTLSPPKGADQQVKSVSGYQHRSPHISTYQNVNQPGITDKNVNRISVCNSAASPPTSLYPAVNQAVSNQSPLTGPYQNVNHSLTRCQSPPNIKCVYLPVNTSRNVNHPSGYPSGHAPTYGYSDLDVSSSGYQNQNPQTNTYQNGHPGIQEYQNVNGYHDQNSLCVYSNQTSPKGDYQHVIQPPPAFQDVKVSPQSFQRMPYENDLESNLDNRPHDPLLNRYRVEPQIAEYNQVPAGIRFHGLRDRFEKGRVDPALQDSDDGSDDSCCQGQPVFFYNKERKQWQRFFYCTTHRHRFREVSVSSIARLMMLETMFFSPLAAGVLGC